MRVKAMIALLWLGVSIIVLAFSPVSLAQEQLTTTPDAEGAVMVEVLPNDSLWAIASRAGISLQELLTLNKLSEDAIIHPGQLLIVGRSSPTATATATVELPTVTPTTTRPPPTPTRTPLPQPRTALCFEAFDDLNRDGVHNVGEPFRSAVAFTIFNDVTVVANYVTDGISEPFCLESMAPGDYNVTRSIGRDETVTTPGDWALTLTSGSVLNLEFGSFTGVSLPNITVDTATPAPPSDAVPSEIERSTEFGSRGVRDGDPSIDNMIEIAGVLVLLLGGGILLVVRVRHFKSRQ